MPIFEPGDVVKVPFPYTDRATRQRRPALVIAAEGLGIDRRLLWVLMITSAENRAWPGDVSLEASYAAAGLPAPSLIRTVKIATIDVRDVTALGRIQADELAEVRAQVQTHLGNRQALLT